MVNYKIIAGIFVTVLSLAGFSTFVMLKQPKILGTSIIQEAPESSLNPSPSPVIYSLPVATLEAKAQTIKPEFIDISGQYTHRNESVNYKLSIPKKGGDFTGSFT